MNRRRTPPWTRVRDTFPLTVTGLFVVLGSAWALLAYGLGRIDLVLLVVGAVGLFASLLCLLSMLVGLFVVRARLPKGDARIERLEIECGQAVPTQFTVVHPWWLLLCDVRWSWVTPPATIELRATGGRLHEHVIASRRGAVDAIVRRIVVGDVLGLWRVAWRHEELRPMRFLPSTGALRKVDVVRGMTGGDALSHPDGPPDGDLLDIRNYQPGDPIRFVLWRVFGRTRQLVVRRPERAISMLRRTAAYLVATHGDEPAAGAARLAVEQGSLGDGWMLGADGCDQPASTRADAMEILTRSADTGAAPASGLPSFVQRLPRDLGRIVLFVPGRAGPWLEQLKHVGAQHRRRIDVFVCIDGVEDERAARGWQRREQTRAASTCTTSELAKVCSALGEVGARVCVIDRSAGRMYGDGHIGRLAAG